MQSSVEDTGDPEISEGSSSDYQEDTFGDGEESFGDDSDSDESGIEYIKCLFLFVCVDTSDLYLMYLLQVFFGRAYQRTSHVE